MGFWDIAKKVGEKAFDELKSETDMMREYKNKSDSDLSKIAKDGGTQRERRVAKAVLNKRYE